MTAVALLPVLGLCVSHATVLEGDLAEARAFDGRTQIGPAHPAFERLYNVVRAVTSPDDVVAFLRPRTMTLLTGRRSLQPTSLDDVVRSADWFAQLQRSSPWELSLTPAEARASGLVPVWQDLNWVLWRVDPAGS